jgi:soluble lytic murein transglycosylase-like protein
MGASPALYDFIGRFVCGFAATASAIAFVRVASGGSSAPEPPMSPEPPASKVVVKETVPPVVEEDLSRHCDLAPPDGFSDLVYKVADHWSINPRMLALTVYRESRCDTGALGAAGEIGLGQVNPKVWVPTLTREGIIATVDDLYDPEVNLHAVAFILGEMDHMAEGDTLDAVRRYNGSGSRARKYAREQTALYEAMWGETAWIREGC